MAGVPAHFPPHYAKQDDGSIGGFAIDTMDAIVKLAGLKVEYRIYPSWMDVFKALEEGSIDVVPNLGITTTRGNYSFFTAPLETSVISMIVRANSSGISAPEHLQHKKIGAVRSNIGEKIAIKAGYRNNLVIFEKFPGALFALLSGQIDVIIYPREIANRDALAANVQAQIKFVGKPLKEIKRAIAISKYKPILFTQLNQVSQDFISTKQYQDIYTKWYGAPVPQFNAQELIFIFSAVLGLSAFLFFGWHYRGQVRLGRALKETVNNLELTQGKLNYSNNELEQRVRERTTELTSEIERHKRTTARLQDNLGVLNTLRRLQSCYISGIDAKTLHNQLLADILEITSSEYGFIGEVFNTKDNKPYLKTHAITNIAWNEDTRKFYEENAPAGLEFTNLNTLFGVVMLGKETVISNSPLSDSRSGGLPEGHPPLHAFLGLPLLHDSELIGMIGIANRAGGYQQELIDFLDPLIRSTANIIHASRSERDRDEAERKMHIAVQEAERASNAKSQFLSNMSHELRTPLNAIMGFTSLLEMEIKDEQHRDYIKESLVAGEHLLQLINEALDLEKIESGHLDLAIKSAGILPLINETIALIKPMADAAGITIETDIKSADHLTAKLDRTRFKQVLVNILSNAIKYNTEKGKVIITASKPAVDILRIGIQDTGIGIRADIQHKLFTPFERLDIDTNIEGTGIGLALSKKLAEMMGTTIMFESVPGEGSTFWMDLKIENIAVLKKG